MDDNGGATGIIRCLRRVPCLGLIMGLLSGAFSATGGFIVKLIPAIHPVQIVAWRSSIRMLIYFSVILGGRMSLKGAEGETLYLVLRAVIGFMATASAYMSYRLVALADASTIIFAAPVFVSIFARIILNEKCGFHQILNVVIALIGIVLIAKPTFLFPGVHHEGFIDPEHQTQGILAALFASFCFALTFVLMRKIQKTPTEVVVFWFSFSSMCLAILVLSVMKVAYNLSPRLPSTPGEIALIFANSIVGVISQPLLTFALKIEEAGLISLARTVDVALAFFFQIVFLDEPVHWTSILGAVIVCIGVTYAIFRKWNSENPESFRRWVLCHRSVDDEEFERSRIRSDSVVSYTGLKDEYP
ncbi:Solute carrier family 35 member G1 [Halotydeus destructor]|nr:Solute carrier family 35 member G1 [Halotydeus destructor]